MTPQGDHFSHSGKATVSLGEPVGQDQRVGQAHGEHKGHSPAGSRGGNKPAFNANFRRSVEKHVHSVPQPASLCGIVQRTSRSAWSIHFDGLSRRQFAHDAASQQQHSSDCRVRSKISHTISRGNLAVVEHSGAQS